jgi:predicted Ser/Thr protein kinase
VGAGYQATTTRYQTPAGDVVVKRARPSALLGWLNRAALRREHAAYQCLGELRGIPRLYGLLEPDALVIEHIAGRSLRQAAEQLRDRERFFACLRAVLDAMHAAGIAHGDLKRKDNILVSQDEEPYIIDFGTAWRGHHGAPVWDRWLFRWAAQSDDNAWIKLKYRRRFEDVSEADRPYYRPLWIERIARWVRIPYQKLTLRRLRKRWNARGRDSRS